MELFAANHQWNARPDDERFETLSEMFSACDAYKGRAQETKGKSNNLTVGSTDGRITISGERGTADVSHYAFRQLASRVGAPAGYLATLPAPVAGNLINLGLRAMDDTPRELNLLFHRNGGLLLRATMSDKYRRVWNSEVVRGAVRLEEAGWRVAPARPARSGQKGTRLATAADVLEVKSGGGGLSINVGDAIAPAGLYASNHDMFIFMVNEQNRIKDGTPGGLSRGFFLRNSEVGECSLRLTTFLYRNVCGNHIVRSASEVKDLRLKHVGSVATTGIYKVRAELTRYAEASASDLEAKIARSKTVEIAGTREEVLDTLFRKLGAVTRGTIGKAYDAAEQIEDLNPRSPWGMANGLSRVSQETEFQDDRLAIDEAAGRVMEFAF